MYPISTSPDAEYRRTTGTHGALAVGYAGIPYTVFGDKIAILGGHPALGRGNHIDRALAGGTHLFFLPTSAGHTCFMGGETTFRTDSNITRNSRRRS